MSPSKRVLRGRGAVPGLGEGEALVSPEPISFLGGVDPRTGLVIERGHPLKGLSVAGKVLVFPRGKGSTVGSYIIYGLKRYGKAPAAMVNVETEPIIATGCALAGIPLVDRLDADPLEAIKNGDKVRVDGDKGLVEIESE
jgi:predicted aconitase with swiveling domain